MKGPKTATAVLLGLVLLAAAAPASSKPAKTPTRSAHPAYLHYVACGLSQNAKRSHTCRKKRDKAAFFRSNKADVFYTVCVKFPTRAHECKPHQEAEKGILYFNKITSNIPGKHKVTWFVGGKRVGLFYFKVAA
jgi:hypothetical protein